MSVAELGAQSERASVDTLSPQQLRALILAAYNASWEQIAQIMEISKATVKFHLMEVHEKLGTHSTAIAVFAVVNSGILDPEEFTQGFDLELARELTPREREVLEGITQLGDSEKELAERLHIVPKTVEFHKGNAFRKLGVDNQLQAGLIYLAAKRQGIIEPPESPEGK